MGIAFLNPVLLLGLLGVAAPIYVHLRQRQKAKRIQFSTLRFLQASDRHTARRHKIVDLIALVTRCLIVALLALGLSKPVIRPSGGASQGAGAGTTFWAIVVDDSYSMGARPAAGAASSFDQAKDALGRVLDLTAENDEIAVVLTSARTLPGLAEVSHNKYQIKTALESLQPSYAAAAVADGVERALGLLRDSTNPGHELVVITDMQRSAMETMQKIDPLRLTEKVHTIHLLDVGLRDAANATVTSLKVLRAGPYPGVPISFRATIRGSSPSGAKGLSGAQTAKDASATTRPATAPAKKGAADQTKGSAKKSPTGPVSPLGPLGLLGPSNQPGADRECTLQINGERVGSKSVKIAGEGQVDVAFEHVLMTPGPYVATVSVDGDALDADNQRMAPCDVFEQVSILLLADPPDRANPWDAAFFLSLALTPQETRTVVAKSPIHVERRAPKEAVSIDPLKYNIVFCADLHSMTPDTLKALLNYVNAGGRLVVFAGEWAAGGQSPFYGDRALFGWKFTGQWAVKGVEDEPLTMNLPDMAHPLFRALADDPAINFQSTQFYRHITVAPASLDQNSQVVASLSDEAPYLLEKRYGTGSVLCFTVVPTPEWSSLPTQPMFLPLIHELVKYGLSGAGAGARVEQVSQGFEIPLPVASGQPPTMATLSDPDGVRATLPLKRDVSKLTVPALERPGLHTIELRYGASPHIERLRVVANVDPAEGDLTRAEDEKLRTWLPFYERWSLHTNGRELAAAIEHQRKGFSLTGGLLAAALALFVFESYLANLLLPRHEKELERRAARLSPARLAEAARK